MRSKNPFFTVLIIGAVMVMLSGCSMEDSMEELGRLMGLVPAAESYYEESVNEGTIIEEETAEPEAIDPAEIEFETSEPSEPAEPEPDITTVTVSATGDCAIGRVHIHGYNLSFEDYYDRNGPDYFMKNVREIFREDDFTLINCECTLTNETVHVDKEYCIKGYPEYVQILSGSSVEGATLGNNHNADYGEQSLVDTEETLDGAGIQYALNDHYGIYETESGIRIGFVSVSMLGDFPTRSSYMETGLTALRDQVDILIACPHMGIERENYANSNQVAFFRQCVDWGADLVVGNHPHVLQGMEVYKGKVIAYSLGNFCFGANHNPSDYDTVILQQTFTFVDGELQNQINARIIPCSVSSEKNNNNYQPTPYEEAEDIDRVITKMNDFSKGLGDIYFDADGALRPRLD
ncbi:MAG: CapA family protein [Lachnospiraceae bacterium]|nr:CapA family protein [Lachnospiraceae bacterium]